MKERDIFDAALAIADPDRQVAFLASACEGDAQLEEHLRAMLRAQRDLGSFLEMPAVGPTVDTPGQAPLEDSGTVIGPYKLLEPIGEGGMGVVYVAEQAQPVRRRVALKIIKPGMDTKQVIARFEAERQALAMMDHPNIAKVHDAGATESGRPYFVMELVRGIPITEYCDRERLSIRERLELFVLVCRAVQHAHQKGIIHRDLKPSNILVTVIDGAAVPKVIDFGVAKATGASLTERTVYTAFHQFVGTPLYMSPEQADLAGMDIDTRSDIYSLGVLLYELLTGTTPFDKESLHQAAFDEMRRMIRETEPPRPSTRLSTLGVTLATVSERRRANPRVLDQTVRGELDWIVMKALEKDRRRRYETANDFAADLMRYLTDQPVEACPPSAWYRFGKFARRNRAALATAGLVGVALIAGTSVSTWQAIRATRAERRAMAEAEKANAVNDFLTQDLLSQAEPDKNAFEDEVTLREVLDRAAATVGERFAGRPEVEEAVRATIARTYHGLGAWEKAERQWRAVLESSRRRLGPEAVATYEANSEVAHILYHHGRLDEALALAEPAADGLARTLGADDPRTLTSRCYLALAFQAAGRIDQAIAVHETTLESRESRLGLDHPDTFDSRHYLAGAYLASGRTDEAIALAEATRKRSESKLGPSHPTTLESRQALAEAYRNTGRTVESIALLEPLLKGFESRYGPNHPSTVGERAELLRAYLEARRFADAIALAEATQQRCEAKLGPDHSETLRSRDNLAYVYNAAGRTAEAIALHEATLKLQESKIGPDHPDTLGRRYRIAELYRETGCIAEAIALHEATLKRRESRLGADHLDTLTSRNDLGLAYAAAGRIADAVALHEAALKGFESMLGPHHPYTLCSRENLADAYFAAGRIAEAVVLYEVTLKHRESKDGLDHRDTLRIRNQLAIAYDATGRAADAVDQWGEMLPAVQRVFGPDHPSALTVANNLAKALVSLGRGAEAEPLIAHEVELLRRQPDLGNGSLAYYLTLLSRSLLLQDRYSEAEAVARETMTIYEKSAPNHWCRSDSESVLGASLLGQRKYTEAEPLLLSGYERLLTRDSRHFPDPEYRNRKLPEVGARIVQLYDAWGQPEKASAWRARLSLADELPAHVFARP